VLRPNQLWTIDFKGQFRTTDHHWCYPLTVMDGATRYLLEVHAHAHISSLDVLRRMQWLFEQFGLPAAIHTDNGVPFASPGFTGLSRLSVYWLKLGIRLQRSRPGCPQDNAAHERMHQTLKAHTTRPPGCNLRAQQHRFDHFRLEYNCERPHESLADRTPAELYQSSARAYPRHLPEPHYPGHFHVRRVRTDGSIKWLGHLHFTSTALCGEWVALEEVDDGVCSVWFMNYLLGRLDAHSMTFTYVPV
jgi:transposase InsO family protein